MAEETLKKYDLLIELIFGPPKKFPFFKRKVEPIQNTPFEYGIKIKNLGSAVFPGATVKNISFHSGEGKYVEQTCDREFKIKELNPNGEEILWLDKTSTHLDGLMWFRCDIIANNAQITSFQYMDGCAPEKHPEINKWGISFFIKGLFQLQQKRTNTWLLILTLLTFLEGIFGLKNIFIFFIRMLKNILTLLLDSLKGV